MSKFYMMPGTDNVVVLKQYRTYKEAFKLFTSYKNKVFNMKNEDLEGEKFRIQKEMRNFPNHLLTKVKVQIFENATGIKL